MRFDRDDAVRRSSSPYRDEANVRTDVDHRSLSLAQQCGQSGLVFLVCSEKERAGPGRADEDTCRAADGDLAEESSGVGQRMPEAARQAADWKGRIDRQAGGNSELVGKPLTGAERPPGRTDHAGRLYSWMQPKGAVVVRCFVALDASP